MKDRLNHFVEEGYISGWAYNESDKAVTYNYYQEWIKQGLQGDLAYLEGERGIKRKEISSFFSNFKSSIVFLFSYSDIAAFLEKFYKSNESNGLKISSYVFGFEGNDYHLYLREKLETLAIKLIAKRDIEYRLSLDIHPVLERDLAVRSGLGWFGKNSMFISKEKGSFLMIGALFFSEKLNLEIKSTVLDHCGKCTACIDSCPTNAILDNRTLDVKKCISNYTIELFKEADAPKGMIEARGEIFGCDICQVVCPWNKKPLNVESNFSLSEEPVSNLLKNDPKKLIVYIEKMSNREFKRVFKGTALERTGRIGLLKNLRFWQE